jgi:methoxymalonate biosynthesis acyl carrier protein
MIAAAAKDKIRAFILTTVRKPDLGDDEDIFVLGLVNSLFAMQLVMFVENEFGLKVEDEDLEVDNFKSVDAIAGLVERKT